ncbi:14972_t:CDS:1, partial [Dentiscutata heterogama]
EDSVFGAVIYVSSMFPFGFRLFEVCIVHLSAWSTLQINKN